MGNTHTATSGDVKAGQGAVLLDDGDKADIIREDIDVVLWRNDDGNFKLDTKLAFAVIIWRE